jgi:hypothetical protein
MKKPAVGRVAIKPLSRAGSLGDEPTKLVCAGLALAILVLALRIASIW